MAEPIPTMLGVKPVEVVCDGCRVIFCCG
jgi:hypothetical protein